jgi:hypothetical protein
LENPTVGKVGKSNIPEVSDMDFLSKLGVGIPELKLPLTDAELLRGLQQTAEGPKVDETTDWSEQAAQANRWKKLNADTDEQGRQANRWQTLRDNELAAAASEQDAQANRWAMLGEKDTASNFEFSGLPALNPVSPEFHLPEFAPPETLATFDAVNEGLQNTAMESESSVLQIDILAVLKQSLSSQNRLIELLASGNNVAGSAYTELRKVADNIDSVGGLY